MPRFAFCAGPGDAKSHKTIGGLLGAIISLWFSSKVVAIFVAAVLGIVIPILLLGGCFGIIPATITIVSLLQDAKEWYYRFRLLCIEDRNNCVLGSVLHQPEVSLDGDRKMDLLLAPFTEAECFETLATHLNANAGLLSSPATFNDPPFFTGAVPVPFLPFDADILNDPNAEPGDRRAERQKIADYMKAIEGSDPEDGDATSKIYNNIQIGWMDRLLDPGNTNGSGQPKNFQGRYYRKDPAIIPPGPLSDAIPLDYDPATPWQATDGSLSALTGNNPYEVDRQPRPLNALFRFDEQRLLPYLHCEVDGNYLQLLFDELSLSVTTFGIAYGFMCFLLPPYISIPVALILALLIYLLQRWLDGGGDRGQADPVDVEFDDPDNFGEDGQQLDGDLVAIFGPWIMDTEHAQYFEIHPVNAYYILGRNGRSEIDLFDSAAEQRKSGTERLHNGLVDAAMVSAVCAAVNEAEGEDPGPVILRGVPAVLSHGLTTKWGGGGFGAVVE